MHSDSSEIAGRRGRRVGSSTNRRPIMARKRSRKPPELEYGLCEGAYYLDHGSTLVRAGVEETAAALVAVTRADVWERNVAGREVAMRPRACFVYRPTDQDSTVIVDEEVFPNDQLDVAI